MPDTHGSRRTARSIRLLCLLVPAWPAHAALDVAESGLLTTLVLLALAVAVLHRIIRLNRRLAAEIAERKAKDSRLAESERQFASLIETAPFPVVLTNAADGRLVYINQRTIDQFSVQPDDALGHSSFEYYVNPGDSKTLRQQLRKKGAVHDFETRMHLPDGRQFWAYLSATMTHFNGEEVVFASFNDITERKRIETRLNRLIDLSPIPMAIAERHTGEWRVNHRFESLFGYAASTIQSISHWQQLAYPDPSYRDAARQMGRDLLAVSKRTGTTAGPIEVRIACADGSVKDIEIHYVDLDEHGLWTFTDITDHNRDQDAIRLVNDELRQQLAENRRLHEQLREQAIRDPLTGLYNRRYLDETMERELANAQREGYPLTVIMLDIDHFKRINDTYGHPAGDEMLKMVGALLRSNARSGDIACRYGGEEFTLVLPRMSAEAARARAEHWRSSIAAMQVRFGEFAFAATISIGIAAFPGNGRSRDELIEAADQALYQAKHNGRNRIEMAS